MACWKVPACLIPLWSVVSVRSKFSFLQYLIKNVGRLLAQLKQDKDALGSEPDDDTEDIDTNKIVELNCAARVAKEDEDDEDNYDITGPRVIADVKLAKTIGM